MSRFNNISMESAIAFSGTDHETEIMDTETQTAVEVERSSETPDSDATNSAMVNEDAVPHDGVTVKDTLDGHLADNPFLPDDFVELSTDPAAPTPVKSLESILEDLEGALPQATLVDNSPTDGSDKKNLFGPELFDELMRQQGYKETQVEHHVKVDLDDESKTALDADIQEVIDIDPVACESLESIIICGERNVHTLIGILKDKIVELK